MKISARQATELLAGLGDAIVVTDTEGMITGWHGSAERLLGLPAAAALGRPVSDIVPDLPVQDPSEIGSLAGAPGVEVTTTLRQSGGSRLNAAVTVRVLEGPDGGVQGLVSAIRPMGPVFDPVQESGRRRVNPEWDRTLGRIVRGLIDVAAADVNAVEQTATLAGVLVTQARRMIPTCQVAMSLVPHDRQEGFRIIAGAGTWAESLVGREWPRAGTVAGQAMQDRRPIETLRLRERSNLAATIAEGEIVGARLVPLWTRAPLPDGRDAIGVIGFYRTEHRYFTPWERRLIAEFCRLASLMLQGAELRAAVGRSTGRLQSTVEAAYRFTGSLAAGDVLPALVDAGRAWGDSVLVLRVEDGEASVLAARGPGAGALEAGRRLALAGLRAPDGTPLAERAMELGRPVAGAGWTLDGLEAGAAEALAELRSAAAVPVAVMGRASVVLVVGRRDRRRYNRDELGTLQTVASVGGVALRNAWLYEEVQEAGRVKTDFLNMAAHELRTPLTVVRGYLSMLADGSFGDVPPDLSMPIGLLQLKTDELGRLVDDLLLAARLDTGRLAVNLAALDLYEAAREAVERARQRAQGLAADLRLQPARRPVVVVGDRDHVAQVLDALVANALSYAGESPPWVRVRVRGGEGQGRVEVEDHGRGIPSGERERIFERFTRLHDERFAQEPGTGLGLHIARELALQQHGVLELKRSRVAAGSLFVLALPEVDERDAG